MSSTIPSHIGSRLGKPAPKENISADSELEATQEEALVVDTAVHASSEETEVPVKNEDNWTESKEHAKVKKRKARNIGKRKTSNKREPNVEVKEESAEKNAANEPAKSHIPIEDETSSIVTNLGENTEPQQEKEIPMPAKKNSKTDSKTDSPISSKTKSKKVVNKKKNLDQNNDKTEAQLFVEKLSTDTQSFLEKLRKERIQRSKKVAEMKQKIKSDLAQNQTKRSSQQKELANQIEHSRQERITDLKTIKKEVKQILKK